MTRSRTVRRQLERDRKKLDEAKLKLAMLDPGYHTARPIAVDSASVIEPHVRGMQCPVCGVGYRVVEHRATPEGRIVRAQCPRCGRSHDIHFVLRENRSS